MKKRRRLHASNFFFLTLAGIINAIGVTMFIAPVGLYDSGISGTSMLLGKITPEWFTLSLALIILNLPLFIFGWKRMGTVFSVYSVYAVAVYSLAAWVINSLLPFDLSSSSPFTGADLLLSAVFGGLISGVGSGLTIRYGGAIDGIEVMAVVFSKKLGLTIGGFVMVYNSVLYIVCGIIFKSWILPLYSIITYQVALRAVDFIVDGLDRSKSVMVITEHPDDVSRALIEAFESGTTILPAKGGFSGKDKAVIYFVVNRFQVPRLRSVVRAVDPKSYVTVSDVADVIRSE